MTDKDFALTHEELERKLGELQQSCDAFEPVRSFACCYAPVAYKPKKMAKLECVVCGKKLPRRQFSSIEEDDYRKYVDVAKRFVKLGYDAEIRCYCANHNPSGKEANSNIFFAFRAKGDNSFHESELNCSWADTRDLYTALEFLSGAKTVQELDGKDVLDSQHERAEEYIWALERVLGIAGKELISNCGDDGYNG